MIYCDINHHQIESYGDYLKKCLICIGLHKVENHQYRVARYNKIKGKIYPHIIPKYANCGETHIANFPRCVSKHQADIKARKEKKMKKKIQTKNISTIIEEERRKLSLQLNIEMEIEKSWTLSLKPKEVKYEKKES